MKRWIANKLVKLARWIDPPNKETKKFLIDQCVEAMITGVAGYKVTKINKEDFYSEN